MPVKRFQIVLLMLLSAVLSGAVGSARAQTPEPSALMKFLARVPNEPNSDPIAFVDLRALVASRPNAAQVTSAADYDKLDANGNASRLYLEILRDVVLPVTDFTQVLRYKDTRTTTGIDLFAIEQIAAFGAPPQNAALLRGKFDADAINSALLASKFKRDTLNGNSLWCNPGGCELGDRMNMTERTDYNPFGGALGRKQPIVLANDGTLFSSPNFALVQRISALDPAQALANAPEFRALDAMLKARGTLLQELFVRDTTTFSSTAINFDYTPATAISGTLKPVPLPAYSGAVLAHVVNGADVYTLVGLVYDRDTDARAAGGAVFQRMNAYRSVVNSRTLRDAIKDRNGTLAPYELVNDAPTGKTVLVIPIRSVIESDQPDSNGYFAPSGVLFRMLVEMYYQRDLAWLQPGG